MTTKYRHKLLNNSVNFGTPVVCQYDLQCGDLTASAIYGGAATQITNAINNAIQTTYTKSEVDTKLNLKQNTMQVSAGKTGEVLLENSNTLKRLFAVSPVVVNTYLNVNNPDDPKNLQIELSLNQTALNPFWCAGKVKATSPLSILCSKGRIGFTVTRDAAFAVGTFIITFDQPHPDGKDYVLLTATEAYDDYIRSGSYEPNANGFHIVVRNGNAFVDANFSVTNLA